jgi:hypothetical protein
MNEREYGIKLKYCAENGIPLRVIPYTEKDIEKLVLDFCKQLKKPSD